MQTKSLAVVMLLSATGEVGAFFPKFFGGGGKNKNENQVAANNRNNKNNNMDNVWGDFGVQSDSAIKKMSMKLAYMSVSEEAEKFEEALLAVMSQRVQEYLKVKLGDVDNDKLKQIVATQEFKNILAENLQEFRDFYAKQVETRASDYVDQALDEHFSKLTIDFNDWGSKKMKTDQEVAYEIIEKLNNDIFESTMKRIKQMMTVAIMETQALLDRINVNEKKIKI